MAPNKKKKKKSISSTSTPTNGTINSNSNKKQPRKCSVPELIQAAEHAATTMMDLKNAITLYTMALQKLLSSPQSPQDHVVVTPETPVMLDLDATATNPSPTATTANGMILDIYEKRAELYIELQQTDLALHDYQELLRHLQQLPGPGPGPELHVATNTLLRQATVHLSMGQLSQAEEALQSYQTGKQCLRTALTAILQQQQQQQQHQPENSHVTHVSPSKTTTSAEPTSTHQQQQLLLQEEIQQQYCRVCCCIAELYLTDLCYSDQAEQFCEESLQESLTIIGTMTRPSNDSTASTTHHCIETYQMIASLRFSQKRNTEAHEYMKQVYEPISVGCQALAVLVGLRTKADHDTDDGNTDAAMELTALEHVQSLPPIEFRISTSKLLLECAGTLPYAPTGSGNSSNDMDDIRDSIATEEQQEYAIKAMDVIGSCLAEQDEMYECWILLGDAMIFLEKESAYSYWNRALQILVPIQQQLQQELRESHDDHPGNMNDDNENQDDPIQQQQLDTILIELDQLQERVDWAQRSGFDDENGMTTTTTDGMEE